MSAAALLVAATLGTAPLAAPEPALRPTLDPTLRSTAARAPDAEFSSGPRSVAAPTGSAPPPVRPALALLAAPAPRTVPSGSPAARLCRDPRLEGSAIQPIRHATLPCGIAAPVRLEAVSGVRLSPSARLTCGTARALADWIDGVLRPAARETLSTTPRQLRIAGSYACRTRNHRKGARISEHGKGRAVDISAITFDDGRRITVAGDWNRGEAGRLLRLARRGACGLFTTVLGPGSDPYHDDHFHFDTAERAGRKWCR